MFVIAGLGNPGREYEGTRHNAGFNAIDAIADKYGIEVNKKRHKALIGKGIIEGRKVVLAKPLTFMNLSGESVKSLVSWYRADVGRELIIIHDDVNLEVGQLRIREKGSDGGHNGIKSIIAHLGTEAFQRIRIGVGEKPAEYNLADYVLGHFCAGDNAVMREAYKNAARAAGMMAAGRTGAAMNEYNRKKKEV